MPPTYPPPSLKRRWRILNENIKCRQFIESMQDGQTRGATYLEILAAEWVRLFEKRYKSKGMLKMFEVAQKILPRRNR